jgi:hypothetical protein
MTRYSCSSSGVACEVTPRPPPCSSIQIQYLKLVKNVDGIGWLVNCEWERFRQGLVMTAWPIPAYVCRGGGGGGGRGAAENVWTWLWAGSLWDTSVEIYRRAAVRSSPGKTAWTWSRHSVMCMSPNKCTTVYVVLQNPPLVVQYHINTVSITSFLRRIFEALQEDAQGNKIRQHSWSTVHILPYTLRNNGKMGSTVNISVTTHSKHLCNNPL